MDNQLAQADRGEMAELQKTYSEAILRTSRFLVSTLIILVVLAVIVGQELREYRKEERRLSKEIIGADKELKAMRVEIKDIYNEIQRNFSDGWKGKVTEFELGQLRKHIVSVDESDTEAVKALQDEEPKLEKILEKLREESSKQQKENEARKSKERGDKIDSPGIRAVAANISQQVSAENTRSDARLRVTATVPQNGYYNRQELLDGAINLVSGYKAAYHKFVAATQHLATNSKEKERLNSNKKSIPTPFGSFDVLPKLALLAVAFATLLSYISFHLSILRIRAFARDYSIAYNGQKMISPRIPAPAWLYSTEPDLEQYIMWRKSPRSRLILSLTLHGCWLILAGWLVWECLGRWNSAKALLYSHQHFVVYALIICSAVSAGLAVWQFVPVKLRNSFSVLENTGKSYYLKTSRRTFLYLGILTFLTIATGSTVLLLRKTKNKNLKRPQYRGSEFGANPGSADWIVNQHTRVIHHAKTCRNHLPSQKTRVSLGKAQTDSHIHSGCEIRIWEEVATKILFDERSNEFDIERAIGYLGKAIDMSPLSYHLYDRLIGVYGRLCRYNEITSLLEGKLKWVRLEIEKLGKAQKIPATSKKELKRLQLAEKQFWRA